MIWRSTAINDPDQGQVALLAPGVAGSGINLNVDSISNLFGEYRSVFSDDRGDTHGGHPVAQLRH